MTGTITWGILGAGAIGKAFARGCAASKSAKLLAVASRSQEKADGWGKAENIAVERRYGSYEALLADRDVQAVYVATPHPQHVEWAIKAMAAGKHVLCEKPFGVNYAEAMRMIEAARKHKVFLMEAFMYRCHPQTKKLVDLIKEKIIGEVRVITATFGFNAGFNAESRLFKNDLAGGGILDVGCYAVSMSRLVAGAATGKDFADPMPSGITATGHLIPETGVDGWAIGTLKFPGDIVAQISTAVQANLDNTVRIVGSEGSIFLPNPWTAAREGSAAGKIIVHKKGEKEPREIIVDCPVTAFALEVDVASNAILAGKQQPESPAMTWDDTLGNMKTLDAWRGTIGLTYEMEKFDKLPTISGKRLARCPKSNMKYGQVPGLQKEVSRLVMGVDNIVFPPTCAAMWDDFFIRGGNCWDSAYIYGGGACERALGAWIKARNIREQVVILDKGVHSPECYPEVIGRQLKTSLERLQTDYVDIYMMHRDNTDAPVGEFVDALNDLVKAGKIKVFGGSNWTLERVQAANDYAKKNNLQGFGAVSNNFSLAHMVDPVWAGCIHNSDPASREWYTKTQTALMPWSSQARGFFLPEIAAPDKQDNPELVRCWYSDDNFKRQARAIELAKKYRVEPINIALAYVLCQPFPTFPLIGPRTLWETRSSFNALDVQLSPQELEYLSLER